MLKISFTGLVEVGKLLMCQCSEQVKRTSLELGGNAPFIVFDDADLDSAVLGALSLKYRNTGQTCICANRLLIQSGIYDEFSDLLARYVQSLRIDPDLLAESQQGSLINLIVLERVEYLVKDAS